MFRTFFSMRVGSGISGNAVEFVWLLNKTLFQTMFCENVLRYGTGLILLQWYKGKKYFQKDAPTLSSKVLNFIGLYIHWKPLACLSTWILNDPSRQNIQLKLPGKIQFREFHTKNRIRETRMREKFIFLKNLPYGQLSDFFLIEIPSSRGVTCHGGSKLVNVGIFDEDNIVPVKNPLYSRRPRREVQSTVDSWT